ncbi:putative L-cysteine desulfhydrase 1 isoform X2 [Lingula anatina]|uniref:L-cysteine desulfhydrase 1 isoform X2 n=1 Tax=Lingula anatina TaxID=7574 RepID=A0A1S3J6P9_LINAN|nr:putative L-cysteine desulfhydrase 1 isoform X2 [Lingula anatina]|eukprot:XP_013405983.1 putative L-cysteine desulfhydrase 1 isoform X2 [Lingula anatina]
MSTVRRDFGSFHSSNVQELLELKDDDYQLPPLPVQGPNFLDIKPDLHFGKSIKNKYFILEEECTFLNHGAFGATLKDALLVAQKWQMYTEKQPLRFFDRELLPLLVYVTRRLAKFVGCDPRDLLLVQNATTGINCVIKNLGLGPGDVIFSLSVTYGAVKKLLKHICAETGSILQEETVQFPITSRDQLISLVESTLRPEVTKLAVFDHIPSNIPFIMPIQEIIAICHKRGVPVLVDGAHALGSLPLDIASLKPDYYISNAHKWFCCPKGCAFLYVKRELQSVIRPLVISHGFGSGFNSEFIWSGLKDYSPFLSMPTVIDFWETVGPDTMRKYMYQLCHQAAEHLVHVWNTDLIAPADMFGSMSLVRLPDTLYNSSSPATYQQAEVIQNKLYYKFNIEVPIKAVEGILYVRISSHIYNTIDEYKYLGDAVLKLSED